MFWFVPDSAGSQPPTVSQPMPIRLGTGQDSHPRSCAYPTGIPLRPVEGDQRSHPPQARQGRLLAGQVISGHLPAELPRQSSGKDSRHAGQRLLRGPEHLSPELVRIPGPTVSSGRGGGENRPDPGGMGLDESLVGWTDSFMRDQRVILSVDGQDDEAKEFTASLP